MGSFDSDKLNTTKARLTVEGGFAIAVTAEENLAQGELVAVGTADGKVVKAAIDSDMPVGVVYAAALANAEVWIVVAGIGYVLPNAADTAARANVIYSSSTTAGRVSQAATLPSAANHNREVGHWLDAGTGAGVLTRAIIHWN